MTSHPHSGSPVRSRRRGVLPSGTTSPLVLSALSIALAATIGGGIASTSTASDSTGGAPGDHLGSEDRAPAVVEARSAELFGHVEIDGSHEGVLRYERYRNQWMVGFDDRLDLSPWGFYGYVFHHDGTPLVEDVRFVGSIGLESTEQGVVVTAGSHRLLVEWADVPPPDPTVELRWILEGNAPVSAPVTDANAIPEWLDDEACPGGWCWCTGPQGTAYGCCGEGQEPVCECTGGRSIGGCQKAPDDLGSTISLLDG